MSLTISVNRPPLHGYIPQVFPLADGVVIAVVYQKPDAIVYLELRESVGGPVFDVLQFKFSPDTKSGAADFVTQAYVYIKSRPEFAAATDS